MRGVARVQAEGNSQKEYRPENAGQPVVAIVIILPQAGEANYPGRGLIWKGDTAAACTEEITPSAVPERLPTL